MKVLCLLLLLGTVLSDDTCNQRWESVMNSYNCVCNKGSCHTLAPLPTPVHWSVVESYETDQWQKRFEHQTLNREQLINQSPANAELTLNIEKERAYQAIQGFGSAFNDQFGRYMSWMSPELRDRIMRDLYDKDGLEYNMGRIPMAGTDFGLRKYSYDDVENDFELKHFNISQEDYEWKIPYVKRALELSPDTKLFATPWSPPAWLKTNNQLGGLGILKGEPGSQCWKTFAQYFVKFFDAYKQQGIQFWGLTPANEPWSGLHPGYSWNCIGFTSWMERDLVKTDLGPALEAAGYGDINIMVYDHDTEYVYQYARDILWDSEAAKYVKGVAFHWYGIHDYEQLARIHQEFPNVFLLMTEASEGYNYDRSDSGVTLGNWTRAETYASDIIGSLNAYTVGYIDWTPAVINKPYQDAPLVVFPEQDEYVKQPMYYALAHFSKFLPRGSVRVHSEIVEGDKNRIKFTSFKRPDGNVVLVFLNESDAPVTVKITNYLQGPFVLTLNARSIRTLVTNY